MDVSELLARYAAGQRDFRDADLRGVDLSGAKLRGVNLRGVDLSNADLSRANLSFAQLGFAKLICANLSDAKLTFANLINANLSGVILTYVNLTYANLARADLIYANLACAKLSCAKLSNAKLIDTKLIGADLSGANLTNADLTNANLAEADFTNATLTGAKLDGTILFHQKIAEQLQKQNQTLTKRVKLLEEKLQQQKLTQDLNTARNQGINAPHKWKNFYFRSKSEIKIAEALDRAGVLFYPNSKARLNKAELRVNKESDFLVFHSGKFGILEVDGREFHQTAADDHERDRLFKRHGIRIIERFDATRCWNQPEQVVKEFLEILSQA